MGSTLLQVGSVHCFSLNFYDITVSYTQLHVYIYKHKFQKHTNLDTVSTAVSLVTNIQNRVIHLLYCTFKMF